MFCYGCNLTSICKVFEMAKCMSPSINIQVHDCRIKTSGGELQKEVMPPVKINSLAPRSEEQMQNISDRIKSIINKDKAIMPAIEKNTTETTVCCDLCDKETLFGMVQICDHCDKRLCDECATFDMSIRKPFCEECWDMCQPSLIKN